MYRHNRFIAVILLTASASAGWAQTTPPANASGGAPFYPNTPNTRCGNCGTSAVGTAPGLRSDLLKGWTLAGNAPQDYELGLASSGMSLASKKVGQIRSKTDAKGEGFGTVMQKISAQDYRGQRVRFSAQLRVHEVENGAGLWFRVDGADGKVLAFDNMQSRPVVGTQNWKRYDVVIDVPKNGEAIAFGILLIGKGTLGFDELRFDKVGDDVPTTDLLPAALPKAPVNLELKQ